MLGECLATCTLKTSFIDFKKEEANCNRYKRLHVSSLQETTFFVATREYIFRSPSDHILSVVQLYITELVLLLNIAEILLSGRKAMINQLIKKEFMVWNHSQTIQEMLSAY